MTETVWAAVLLGSSMLSKLVVKFFSLSVAFSDKPNDAVRLAQCGMFSVTGTRNSRPCGPHITNGDSIVSPVFIKEPSRKIRKVKHWLIFQFVESYKKRLDQEYKYDSMMCG